MDDDHHDRHQTLERQKLVMRAETHVLQGDDVGMLSVSQQDLHLLRRVSLGLVDDL